MNHLLIMILYHLKIVFSMELEIAIQSGVYKRATKTKNGHSNKKPTFRILFQFLERFFIIFDRRYFYCYET